MLALAMRCAVAYTAISRSYPSNLALAWLRSRSGLKWAWSAMLTLSPGYLALSYWLAALVRDCADGWVAIFACVAFVSALKFVVHALASLVLLVKARRVERRLARG